MLLNLTAVYGLRAMAVLASLQPGESLAAEPLAERTAVPRQYLSKVMRKLVVAGLVRGQRGRGGGFMLLRPPGKVRLVDVLKALDLELDGGCAFGFAQCDPKNPCALHPLWSKLQGSLASWAEGSSLAELQPAARSPAKR
jgi:Rrf2 family protein